ncbi:hypothetical protein ACOSQ2_006749 [Xanthoceras sorbifolium]
MRRHSFAYSCFIYIAASLGNVDIFHCIASKDPNLVASRNNETCSNISAAKSGLNYPKNYETCIHFFPSIRLFTKLQGEKNDEENPQQKISLCKGKNQNYGSSSSSNRNRDQNPYGPSSNSLKKFNRNCEKPLKRENNYATLALFLKLMLKALTTVLGAVSERNSWKNYAAISSSEDGSERDGGENCEKLLVAIQDADFENKNAVLLAVEYRQTSIYQYLLKDEIYGETVFRQVDNNGNNVIQIATTFRTYLPSLMPGLALQMQCEIKWYEHKELIRKSRQWLSKISDSCSFVAALIAKVAYACSSTVPGGLNRTTGKPILIKELPFNIFTIASLIALSSSVTALVFFLTILNSKCQEKDFAMDLPLKLLLGLTFLFVSIASMSILFCSGHFFILSDNLRSAASPMYILTFLPLTFLALSHLPLYFDLIRGFFAKVP